MNYKRMLSISATGLAIAILTTGCELSSPNRASFPNNSSENGTNFPSSDNETNYRPSPNATNYRSTQRDINQDVERISGLNLTNSQKAQIKQIREENNSRILALLSDDQRREVQTNSNGRNKLSMRKLRSLNLSAEQRQEINQITRDQRQQIQEILTPKQRQMMQQGRRYRRGNRSNSENRDNRDNSDNTDNTDDSGNRENSSY
ncbi:Spy/CpxP family protein refolding chaperone [Anabaena sp. WFMT]|uniref:Spy/CpxP family protein refolding chaperone n=1 Tax=Anabaena sp. WFMT TaxID=3449730 RepID=UPI003F2952F8